MGGLLMGVEGWVARRRRRRWVMRLSNLKLSCRYAKLQVPCGTQRGCRGSERSCATSDPLRQAALCSVWAMQTMFRP